MLTNLSFLEKGNLWPPPAEATRLSDYAENRRLYKGDYDAVFAAHTERVNKNLSDTAFWTQLNYFKKVSLKTAGLLWGEPPVFDVTTKGADTNNDPQYKSLQRIIRNCNVAEIGRQCTVDISRYGDGLFLLRRDESKNHGLIDAVSPEIWFPVVKPDNIKEFLYHVLAWAYTEGEEDYLSVQIHARGTVTARKYALNGGIIGDLLEENAEVTGLPDFAVIPMSNSSLSDEIYGQSDYEDFQSVVVELMVRMTQINKILDKHSSPSMQGPLCALRKNEQTGEFELHPGDFFPTTGIDPDIPPAEVSYITWDAELEANFRQVEILLGQLYALSEMSAALFGDLQSKVGNVPSGTALRRTLMATLDRVKRMRAMQDAAVKKAVTLCSYLGGEEIVPLQSEVSLTWREGLPSDPKEDAEIIRMRTGGKSTMSLYRTLRTYDSLCDSDAQSEINEIAGEDLLSSRGEPT